MIKSSSVVISLASLLILGIGCAGIGPSGTRSGLTSTGGSTGTGGGTGGTTGGTTGTTSDGGGTGCGSPSISLDRATSAALSAKAGTVIEVDTGCEGPTPAYYFEIRSSTDGMRYVVIIDGNNLDVRGVFKVDEDEGTTGSSSTSTDGGDTGTTTTTNGTDGGDTDGNTTGSVTTTSTTGG